ncbi:hypothetical protein GCM10011380_29800 [Sphingomonas metalli]|uniref:TonB C-terminal domain-containing protein n=1 Tax=Sphingomonas metalli TaxID=1779358 RepID=A0A916TB34_9SPHN|nr:energy transducer TonB [Sphingomonas metalli]GGB38430.1 hypothetical protein GCM10011380_29800 [Sphingomonas metalli]
MYADRYTGGQRFSPTGLAVAIGVNAAVIGALMVAAPYVTGKPPIDPPIETYPVPIEPPPPPDPVAKTLPRTAPVEPRIDTPPPPIPLPPSDNWRVDAYPPQPFPPLTGGTEAGTGTGSGTGTAEQAKPAPVLVGAAVDPRYADAFQPAYPPSEQRAGRDGRVTVRVLIGTDGRVKQVERVEATSDAFFRATEQQALRRWRFRPATRDGVAEEAWRTMSVTFLLTEQ